MNKKFNVIKITGFKGLFIAAFVVGCLIAGFLTFPGWVFMNLWNFAADSFTQMPRMNMLHGTMLWCIVALSLYALNQGNFSISLGSSAPMPGNEEKIKEIIRQINEKNATIVPVERLAEKNADETSQNTEEHDDKMIK